MIKTINLMLVIMSEYQNPTVFLPKPALQIDQNKFLLLKELKITVDNVFWIRIFQIKQSLEKKKKKDDKLFV